MKKYVHIEGNRYEMPDVSLEERTESFSLKLQEIETIPKEWEGIAPQRAYHKNFQGRHARNIVESCDDEGNFVDRNYEGRVIILVFEKEFTHSIPITHADRDRRLIGIRVREPISWRQYVERGRPKELIGTYNLGIKK